MSRCSTGKYERAAQRHRPLTSFWLALAMVLSAVAGCGSKTEKLTTSYGGRRGDATSSVNGLSVLAEMFASAGHRVTSRSNAGSGIDELQVIVWAPDNFDPPTAAERLLIENWLSEKPDRTFVYIGRDYDAATAYWQLVQQQAKPGDFAYAAREAALAESAHDTARTNMPNREDAEWFVALRDRPRTKVESFAGEWAGDLDAAKANVVLQGHLDVPSEEEAEKEAQADDEADKGEEESGEAADNDESVDEEEEYEEYDFDEEYGHYYEVLLSANPDDAALVESMDEDEELNFTPGAPLVTRVSRATWGTSQLIVVTNGSFLFNLPLVNHEHRKIAGRLIESCGEPAKVVIWEANSFRATSNSDDESLPWPLNFILLHLAVLGLLYILWRFPIFGLAHTLRPPATSDFAKHIDALGKLTASTKDVGYAQRKLTEYRERVRGDAKDAAPTARG